MTAKLFEAEAIRVLLGNRLLEEGGLFRFHEKGESQGIYLSHLGEIGHLMPSEVRAITSCITSDNDASPRPLLTLPCTLADFMAFEDRVCYFRAHLEAGDETAYLLREIASVNPDAGILACALMPGELPEDEEKLMLLPVEMTAPAAPPEAVRETTQPLPMKKPWQVFKPKRFIGYSAPLYRLLGEVHRGDKPRPTAREVLEVWRTAPPAEIAQVLTDGFDYYNSKGDTQPADLEALRKAINRMTTAR